MCHLTKNMVSELVGKYSKRLKNSVNFWIITANIILAAFAILSYLHGVSVHEAINRPYLGFINSSQELTEVAKAKRTISHQKFETFLVNNGNRPAIFDAGSIINQPHKYII